MIHARAWVIKERTMLLWHYVRDLGPQRRGAVAIVGATQPTGPDQGSGKNNQDAAMGNIECDYAEGKQWSSGRI